MKLGKDLTGKLQRVLRKPPAVIARRIVTELRGEADRWLAPARGRMPVKELLNRTNAHSVNMLWERLATRPFPTTNHKINLDEFEVICPGARDRIMRRADAALERRIDLLGSGEVTLPSPIDWHKDHKTGFGWKPAYFRDIDYNNPDRPSDVKVAWELSRLQWAVPLGQAWLLTRDERYPVMVRQLVEEWIDANPYAGTVNWACTMEVALRIFSWSWFFHAFHDAPSWAEESFRARFLTTLFLHADFTERYIERSDVNGNHFTADAAALVMAGLFFGEGDDAKRWASVGWGELERELPLQVSPDGADFEASTAYHRLVLELFLLPAHYRQLCGEPVPLPYAERLKAMARFIATYTKPDGMSPLWGDADDARALPFGTQALNDHRYLIGLVGLTFSDESLVALASGPREEAYWWFGATSHVLSHQAGSSIPSCAFQDAGVFVMRSEKNHVFIDCGPIGLAGRGGHGHNDCLAFEAVLDGVPLVTDCGAYLYTASYVERNAFRSTAYHNTPQVDAEEINRFIRPDYLWNLYYDAKPKVHAWISGTEVDVLVGSHCGYMRLENPIRPIRIFMLDHKRHALTIMDRFVGDGQHTIKIPLHLAPGISVEEKAVRVIEICNNGRKFICTWSSLDDWKFSTEVSRVSPSYGCVLPSICLVWTAATRAASAFRLTLMPKEANLAHVTECADIALANLRSQATSE
jgi:uncharacterized heparinase superfamily protein